MMSPPYQKRPTHWRKVLLGLATLFVAMLASASWYKLHYSMERARLFEEQGSPSAPRVLIATQGSAFKNAVTAGLVELLRKRSAHIRVVDVTTLPDIDESEWDAMVVIHTWEFGAPPQVVKAFVGRVKRADKLVVLTTSGAGTFGVEGIDVISSASTMVDVPSEVGQLFSRVDAVLNRDDKGPAR